MKAERVKEITETLLEKVGVEASVTAEADEEGMVIATIETEDRGMLIGYHGETLESLQTIVRMMVYRVEGEWTPVILDTGGYRDERREKLAEIAERNAEKARFLTTEVALSPMSPSDRREVHLAIEKIPGVMSESIGEGRDRRVLIRPDEAESQGNEIPSSTDEE